MVGWWVVGHERAVAQLRRGLAAGTLAHAHLFVGPPNVGKTSLALNLAQALNCAGAAEARPCGMCDHCRRILAGTHPDVALVSPLPDEKSRGKLKTEIGIDQMRDLQAQAARFPVFGAWRVFIVSPAERMSDEAANCLLKTLEEPPGHVLILLLTGEELRWPTVVSRCQRVELRPVPMRDIEARLARETTPERAREIARLARGSFGWAIDACGREEALSEREGRVENLLALARASLQERFAFAARLADQFRRQREPALHMLALWRELWRDVLLLATGRDEDVINQKHVEELRRAAEGCSIAQMSDFLHRLREAAWQLSANASPQLALEALVLRLPASR